MPQQQEEATVTFNCQTHSVSVSKDNFTVSNGDKLVLTLNLQTNNNHCTAEFPPGNGAFDFPNGGPPGFRVTRNSDTEVVLTETNNNPDIGDKTYCFKVVVDSDGSQFKSPDPTITNQGIGGG